MKLSVRYSPEAYPQKPEVLPHHYINEDLKVEKTMVYRANVSDGMPTYTVTPLSAAPKWKSIRMLKDSSIPTSYHLYSQSII